PHLSRPRGRSSTVFPHRYRFQMVRVDARAHTTRVCDVKIVRDRAPEQLPRHPVGVRPNIQPASLLPEQVASHEDLPITGGGGLTSPKPALTRLELHLGPTAPQDDCGTPYERRFLPARAAN